MDAIVDSKQHTNFTRRIVQSHASRRMAARFDAVRSAEIHETICRAARAFFETRTIVAFDTPRPRDWRITLDECTQRETVFRISEDGEGGRRRHRR